MMMGRIVNRFAAAAPLRSAMTPAFRAAKPMVQPQMMMAVRNSSTNMMNVKGLHTIRKDSLMFACVVAALIYFVPQDIVFVLGLWKVWNTQSHQISPCQYQAKADDAIEAFKAKKGLENVNISKGRSTWYVTCGK